MSRLDIDLGLALADRHQAAAQAARAMRRTRNIQTPKKSSDRQDPGQEVAQERALDLAGEADVVLSAARCGEVRLDPRGDELRLAALAAAP